MKQKVVVIKTSWRDLLVIATALLVLSSLVLIGYGIAQNNRLAAQSKQHIDCIIKDLATRPPPGTSPDARKYITKLNTDCNIKFTQ